MESQEHFARRLSMAKTLAEKIDFLMTLTNTRNSELGRALHFDASYISRIRSGKRGLPKGQPFIEPAGLYFARAISEDYQKTAAAQELSPQGYWPEDEKKAAALIRHWLKGEKAEQNPVSKLLTAMQADGSAAKSASGKYKATGGTKAAAIYYYGNSGRRDCVINFLTMLCETGAPQTVLLRSEEDIEWMTEDPAFLQTWAGLMMRLIANGGRIRIIHSISRDANEMWEAVQNWIPLYMTGAIEPWYYPNLRDGVLRRTIFVAPQQAAITAVSVKGQAEDGVNAYVTDPKAIEALQQEFNAYLTLCRPLMEISRLEKESDLAALRSGFLKSDDSCLSYQQGYIEIYLDPGNRCLILKTEAPYCAFLLKEPRMVAAMEQYLQTLK